MMADGLRARVLRICVSMVFFAAVASSLSVELPANPLGEDLADASFTQPRKRFVADPDAEAAAALTSKLLVPIFVGWGLFCYAAYRVLKSESWLSVGAVLAFAVLVARR